MASICDKELFSLLIMCYNHEKYIKDAIQSVLAQTYDNIEIIICDDSSKDRSWEQIQTFLPELRKRFKRVVAFRNSSNMGMILSYNKMIKETNGTIIYCLSGDDMVAPCYVADIINASVEYPTEHVSKVVVPKGTKIYEGVAAPQNILDSRGNIIGVLPGGGNQIYIPKVKTRWFK